MTTSPVLQSPDPSLSTPSPVNRSGVRASSIVVIVLLWSATYVAGMFTPALLDDADSVHAEAAKEMLQQHDWVTLHIDNGVRYLEKAPLMYWCVATSYSLFGVKDWSTRLPLVAGVLVLLLITWSLGRKAYGDRGGLYSALVLGTSLGPYLFTRFLIPDMLVTLWLALTFLLFLRSLNEDPPSPVTCWGLAAACALNVLTKGLIGLVFPGAVIFLYLFLTGNLRHLRRLRLFSSALVFFVIAAPWHILAAIRNPDQGSVRGFLWFYFVNEHFLRYLNKRVPRDYDTVPLLVYWALVLVWLVPWVVFLPQALRGVPVRWHELRARLNPERSANLLFLLWALVVLLFFSFSTRQEYYTVPALPALALLIGGWLQRDTDSGTSRTARGSGATSSVILLVIGAAAFVVGVFFVVASNTPAPGTDLAELLKKNPQDYALSFGHVFDITPQAVGAFHRPLLGISLAFLLGTGLNWIFRRHGQPARGNAALALMMVVILGCVHTAFVTFSPVLSSQQLAVAIRKYYRPGDVVVVAGEYEDGSTINFYAGVPLRILHEPSANLWYGSQFPDAPRVFETEASFHSLWESQTRVFLWTDQEELKELGGARRYLVAHNGGKSILTNQPLER
jgi:4-amino-4-deoxy-L-arabinose transferase-like glycosyltransferase